MNRYDFAANNRASFPNNQSAGKVVFGKKRKDEHRKHSGNGI